MNHFLITQFFEELCQNFSCTSDKSAVLLEKNTHGCRVFFFAAQDVNISRGNKYLEATFGAWELRCSWPFPLVPPHCQGVLPDGP